jgi:hypothetical protein
MAALEDVMFGRHVRTRTGFWAPYCAAPPRAQRKRRRYGARARAARLTPQDRRRRAGGRSAGCGGDVTGTAAHELVRMGLALVPEGRGVFGRLAVDENLAMGAYARGNDTLHSDRDRARS